MDMFETETNEEIQILVGSVEFRDGGVGWLLG